MGSTAEMHILTRKTRRKSSVTTKSSCRLTRMAHPMQ